MLFDLEVIENARTVHLNGSGADWTLGFDDLNQHSAAWLINQLLNRGDKEKL